MKLFFSMSLFLSETRSLYIALDVLEFTMSTRLALNSQRDLLASASGVLRSKACATISRTSVSSYLS